MNSSAKNPDHVRRYDRCIYLAPHLLRNIEEGADGHIEISVQILSRRAGFWFGLLGFNVALVTLWDISATARRAEKMSGLMQSVRTCLNEYIRWWSAWLILVPLSNEWYIIDQVFWSR